MMQERWHADRGRCLNESEYSHNGLAYNKGEYGVLVMELNLVGSEVNI